MSRDDLHEVAVSTTPADVEVPKTYTGLIVWAVGKWGIGIVFGAFLVPVYMDLKESNLRFAEVSHANVQVLNALANEVRESSLSVLRVEEAVRRIENDEIRNRAN